MPRRPPDPAPSGSAAPGNWLRLGRSTRHGRRHRLAFTRAKPAGVVLAASCGTNATGSSSPVNSAPHEPSSPGHTEPAAAARAPYGSQPIGTTALMIAAIRTRLLATSLVSPRPASCSTLFAPAPASSSLYRAPSSSPLRHPLLQLLHGLLVFVGSSTVRPSAIAPRC